jgi:hypothetical protein
MAQPHRRRRRVRAEGAPPSPTDLAALTSAVHDLDAESAPEDKEAERGLRGLVGGGSSQVGVRAAMRARDAARPTDAELAAAEAELTIIRRGWSPPPASR